MEILCEYGSESVEGLCFPKWLGDIGNQTEADFLFLRKQQAQSSLRPASSWALGNQ